MVNWYWSERQCGTDFFDARYDCARYEQWHYWYAVNCRFLLPIRVGELIEMHWPGCLQLNKQTLCLTGPQLFRDHLTIIQLQCFGKVATRTIRLRLLRETQAGLVSQISQRAESAVRVRSGWKAAIWSSFAGLSGALQIDHRSRTVV